MSDERLPTQQPDRSIVFDPGVQSPLVGRGLARLAKVGVLDAVAGLAPAMIWHFDPLSPLAPKAAVGSGAVYPLSPDGFVALDAVTGAESWRVHLGHPPRYRPDGNSVAGMVFYNGGKLGALDAATGSPRWQSVNGWWPGSLMPVSPSKRTLYVAAENGVHALDAKTGAERWHVPTGGLWLDNVAPLGEDLVLIWRWIGEIGAVDAQTGAYRWRFSAARSPRPNDFGVVVGSDAVAVEYPQLDTVAALDVRTGRERWRFSDPGRILRPVAIADDHILVLSVAYTEVGYHVAVFASVYCLDADTGALDWRWKAEAARYATGEDYQPGELQFAQEHFYVGVGTPAQGSATAPTEARAATVYVGGRGRLWALDAASGAEQWVSCFDAPPRHGRECPLVGRHQIYTDDGYVINAVDPQTGEAQWAFERTVDGARLPVAFCGERGDAIAVASADGTLCVLDALSGEERHRLTFAPPPQAGDPITWVIAALRREWEKGCVNSLVGLSIEWAQRLRYRLSDQRAVARVDEIERRLIGYRALPGDFDRRRKELAAIAAEVTSLRPYVLRSGPVDPSKRDRMDQGIAVGGLPFEVHSSGDMIYVTTDDTLYAFRWGRPADSRSEVAPPSTHRNEPVEV